MTLWEMAWGGNRVGVGAAAKFPAEQKEISLLLVPSAESPALAQSFFKLQLINISWSKQTTQRCHITKFGNGLKSLWACSPSPYSCWGLDRTEP